MRSRTDNALAVVFMVVIAAAIAYLAYTQFSCFIEACDLEGAQWLMYKSCSRSETLTACECLELAREY